MTRIWVALLWAGCVAAESTPCEDGRVCPEGTTCARVAERPMCATAEQLDACDGVEAFGTCGDGRRCYDGVCLAGGCGNAILDPDEQCDDGNLAAGDTCSATCLVERCGNGAIDLVLGEECDDGAAGVSGDGCSSTCKSEVLGWTEITPAPITARQGVALAYDAARDVVIAFGGLGPTATTADTWMWDRTKWTQLHPAIAPGPRYGHAMAYDPVRERIVLFGGRDAANTEVAETWEWDGVTWAQKLPVTSPMAQGDIQMTFHPGRSTIVLVSRYELATYEWNGVEWATLASTRPPIHFTVPLGYDIANNQLVTCGNKNTNNCVTYVLSGTSWTEVASATTKPATTSGMRMAYDSLRNKLVLYGGTVDDVWEWSGTNWIVAAPAAKPAAHSAPGFAFDGTQIVMFSGTVAGTSTSDTWTWSGTAWTPLAPPVNPAARYEPAFAHDRRQNRAVLFGGSGPSTGFTDTWEWNGAAWRQRTSVGTPPPGNRSAAMTYDLARRRYVLFGGTTPANVELDETWELGSTWQKVTITGESPAARTSASLIYDEARGVSVLFGGRDTAFVALDDTWTYDGTWTRHTPATSPSARSDAAIGYDPTREHVVLFGGGGFPPNDETWEWDGTTWTQQVTTVQPPARIWAQLAYDPLLGGMVLTGGRTSPGGEILDDVWVWNGATWNELAAQSPPAPTFSSVVFFDAQQRALVRFGGRHNTVESSATWALRYAALAAPESCGLADEDRDGDTLKGCDDPDCWGRCMPLCPPASSCPADERCGDGMCSSVEDYLICPGDC